MKSFPDELSERFRTKSGLARAAVRDLHSPTRHLDAFRRWTEAAQIASDLAQYYVRRMDKQRMAREWGNTYTYANTQAGHAYVAVLGQDTEITAHGDYLSPQESAEYRQRTHERAVASMQSLQWLAQHPTPQPREEQSV